MTAVAVLLVVLVELAWLRTGVFRTAQYWVAIAIVWAFQVPVDGWLTKLSAPIVVYNPSEQSGLRFPWDIPVEDFGFGWAMVTLTILVWVRLGRTGRLASEPTQSDRLGAGRTRSEHHEGRTRSEHGPGRTRSEHGAGRATDRHDGRETR